MRPRSSLSHRECWRSTSRTVGSVRCHASTRPAPERSTRSADRIDHAGSAGDSLRLMVALCARTTPAGASLSAAGVQEPRPRNTAKAHLGPWRVHLIFFNVSSSLLDATLVLRIAVAAGAAVGEAEELRIVKNPEDDGHFQLVGTSA